MSVLSREDFLNKIQERVGEDTSDEALQFIEDMTDTFDDQATKINDTTDWKTKYEENDAEWRKKYSERFFHSDEDDGNMGGNAQPSTPLTFEELFKTEV